MFRLFCAMSTLAVLVGRVSCADEDDVKSIQGTWVVVSIAWGGKKIDGAEFEKFRVKVAGNRCELCRDGLVVSSAPFHLDSSKSPKQITVTGAKDYETSKGVYEFRKGMLWVNLGNSVRRPEGFEVAEDWGCVLLELKKTTK